MGRLNPVFVEVTRGDLVESRHRGAAAVVDADGSVVHAWGDVERPVFSRSAIKPLQALPLVETGAAGRFAVSDAEIALACGSHGGAPEHVRPVAAWLERIGLAPADLECGTHPPMDQAAAGALVRAGEDPSPLHNNCAGKHAGFLTTAVHLGETPAGYVRPDHPVQKRIEGVLADLGGGGLEGAARGTEGCGIPVIAMPLTAIARAMARLADPRGLAPARAAAVRRIVAAMTGHPDLVAGRERFDTVAIKAGRGALRGQDRRRRGLRGRRGLVGPGRGAEDRRWGPARRGDGHGRAAASPGRARRKCAGDAQTLPGPARTGPRRRARRFRGRGEGLA